MTKISKLILHKTVIRYYSDVPPSFYKIVPSDLPMLLQSALDSVTTDYLIYPFSNYNDVVNDFFVILKRMTQYTPKMTVNFAFEDLKDLTKTREKITNKMSKFNKFSVNHPVAILKSLDVINDFYEDIDVSDQKLSFQLNDQVLRFYYPLIEDRRAMVEHHSQFLSNLCTVFNTVDIMNKTLPLVKLMCDSMITLTQLNIKDNEVYHNKSFIDIIRSFILEKDKGNVLQREEIKTELVTLETHIKNLNHFFEGRNYCTEYYKKSNQPANEFIFIQNITDLTEEFMQQYHDRIYCDAVDVFNYCQDKLKKYQDKYNKKS